MNCWPTSPVNRAARLRPEAHLARLALGALLLACPAMPAQATMRLGVNTHFGQNWPIAALSLAEASGATVIRDSIPWGAIERTPGVYVFNQRNSGYLGEICARRLDITLMVPPRNPLYVAKGVVQGAAAQRAYGRFVRAVVDRFPCVQAIEVGNEVNVMGHDGRHLQQNVDNYVALVRSAREALKGGRKVVLIGGSSLMIATGFFEKLFAAGMLPLVDAVAIHPYLPQPEGIPAQLARLRAAMARAGGVKPIYATEFGLFYNSPEAAPPHVARVMAILSAEHVAEADWYALKDEPFYPNMGLYAGRAPKPALQLFQRVAGYLRDHGDAARVETGDPLVFAYRFGAGGPSLLWGSGRSARIAGSGIDTLGRAIPSLAFVGENPVFLPPGAQWQLGRLQVLADTFYDAGADPWQALFTGAGGGQRPLRWIDTMWASQLGIEGMQRLALTSALVSAPRGEIVERMRAPATGPLWLEACLVAAKAAPPAISVTVGGRPAGTLRGEGALPALRIDAKAGEMIAIHYAAPGGQTPAAIRRRLRIVSAEPVGPAPCPREPGNQK